MFNFVHYSSQLYTLNVVHISHYYLTYGRFGIYEALTYVLTSVCVSKNFHSYCVGKPTTIPLQHKTNAGDDF